MSAVHKEIARAAFDVLPADDRELLHPHLAELMKSSEYPDLFADRSRLNLEATKAKIDPDAERFLWPNAPQEPWYQRVVEKTADEARRGVSPLRWGAYMPDHYLRRTLAALRAGDIEGAAKFLGVYSHVIGDVGEPVHAVHPQIIDFVVPPPPQWSAFELHGGIEMLGAPVSITGYEPRLLGKTLAQAVMGAIAGLYAARDRGAALAVPITHAIYADNRAIAVQLSSEAQNESARRFADFMYTALWLFRNGERSEPADLNLADYPCAAADVDMLYRYRPARDMSLEPYTGRSRPLTIIGPTGPETVGGLGVLPHLGPPYVAETLRQTRIDYLLAPGAYAFFRGRAGVNPLFEDSAGGVVFRVLVDDQEVFRSASLTRQTPAVSVDVALGEGRWLTLTTHCEPNPSAPEMALARKHLGWASHAVWAQPRLVTG